MKKEYLVKLKNTLDNVAPNTEKLESIQEKMDYFMQYLRKFKDNSMLSFIGLPDDLDIESEEVAELITDNYLSASSEDIAVFEGTGYTPWLDSVRDSIEWNAYDRYERYLMKVKGWSYLNVSSINNSSDIILDHTANPRGDKNFVKKGLVIGDIQSGKTANYTAVINKAIDAGYKLIIVLSGITRDLRNQTQNRFDTEVLGHETRQSGKGDAIGVGKISSIPIIDGLTYSDDGRTYGDLKGNQTKRTLHSNIDPIVAIVKKNTSVLDHFIDILTNNPGGMSYDSNHKLTVPVLIIDDEVDQASVDTKNSESIEEASTINKKIRKMIDACAKVAYIGYTATPFANVFIDPDKESDLYPSDFILNIPTPKGYCGIKEYFGIDKIDLEDDNYEDYASDLFECISKEEVETMFNDEKAKASTETVGLSESLKKAIKYFVISCSIKKSRGIIGHNSMLIHISRFKNPSTTLREHVINYVGELYQKLRYEYSIEVLDYEYLWQSEFVDVSRTRLGNKFNDSWHEISKYLLETIKSITRHILVLNGDSGDMMNYSEEAPSDYIIMGGDKLSRGLTLEGLSISYYYRESKLYDSLLQMGRWFGYRTGWIDVCRIFTTKRIYNDFVQVGKVVANFKKDVDIMYERRLDPREVGQKILYSPNLVPTARNKMSTVTKAKISFSEQLQQIISFSAKTVDKSKEITEKFIALLGQGKVKSNKKVVFRNIQAEVVINYLKEYLDKCVLESTTRVNVMNWINYIENQRTAGELKYWTVVLNSLASDNGNNAINFAGYNIYKPSRTLRDTGDSTDFKEYRVKVNTDPSDFREVFDENSPEYRNVKQYVSGVESPNFDYNHALLSIYVVDLYECIVTDFDPVKQKRKTKRGKMVANGRNVCAPAIWFPKAKDYEKSAVVYYFNKDMAANFNPDNKAD